MASNPEQDAEAAALAAATETIAAAMPRLAHRDLGGSGYEYPFAALSGGTSVAHDPLRRSIADVSYDWGLLELSAGNVWLDLVRAARLKLQPPDEPVLYGFLDRVRVDAETVRVAHTLLAQPAVVHDYLGLTRERAQAYLVDDAGAPSTLNFQHHLRRCDQLYVSAVLIEWRDGAVSVRRLGELPRPPKRQSRQTAPPTGSRHAAAARSQRQPLTAAESAALEAIRAFTHAHHYPPTVRELAAALGVRSLGSVHRLLSQLEQKQAVSREPGRARACVPCRRRSPRSS